MELPPLPQHAIVERRRPGLISRDSTAPFTAEVLPPVEHPGRTFVVRSEVIWPTITADGQLKGPPQLRLEWDFRRGCSGRVVGFRRRGGFGKDGDYGEQIVNSQSAGMKVEHLDPGDYFYTFCTRHSLWGLWHAYTGEVRFPQTIPSVPKVLELMKQGIEFRKLQQEYQHLTAPPPVPEDPMQQWEREFEVALAGTQTRFEGANRLDEQLRVMRKQVEDGPFSPREKRRRLRVLSGLKRNLREKFEL